MTLYLILWLVGSTLVAVAVCHALWGPGTQVPDGVTRDDAAPPIPLPSLRALEPMEVRPVEEMTQVHRMLTRLERLQPGLAKLVLLCWIGGMSPRTAAATLGKAEESVERDLRFARSMLRRQLDAADFDST